MQIQTIDSVEFDIKVKIPHSLYEHISRLCNDTPLVKEDDIEGLISHVANNAVLDALSLYEKEKIAEKGRLQWKDEQDRRLARGKRTGRGFS